MEPQELTLQQLIDNTRANFETELNQEIPQVDKAFLSVESVALATLTKQLFKYGQHKTLQALAITATNDGLDIIGVNYDAPRKGAVPTNIEVSIVSDPGKTIDTDNYFTSTSNGLRYNPDSAASESGGLIILNLTCTEAGSIGNLNDAEELAIGIQVAGVESIATVLMTNVVGSDVESDAAYRQRLLAVIRAVGGGANSSDYRTWAEEVEAVFRAFPYTGRPVDDPQAPPPARTVYIQAQESVDPDGIAPPALLDQVKENIITDPITGKHRQPLGLTDSTLYVQSIVRDEIFVDISGLAFPAGQEQAVKDELDVAVGLYLSETLRPFVIGLDPEFERNDKITKISISNVVQDTLTANQASAQDIQFGFTFGVWILEHDLEPGQLVKLGAISYS